MANGADDLNETVHNRELLLHGAKRNKVLSLAEVQRYGSDSFNDPDYVRLYGMTPPQWYARGVRLLGRTAVECTCDPLANRIGREIAAVVASLQTDTEFTVFDLFAGSCNTLYWILRHVPRSRGIGFELDAQIYEISRKNLVGLDQTIELNPGDYGLLLARYALPPSCAIIVFVAPPWGTALHEDNGLDLRRTQPPIAQIIGQLARTYPAHKLLVAIQVYEKVDEDSLGELKGHFEWSRLTIYDFNATGRNHGVLLGTMGWTPALAPAGFSPAELIKGRSGP